MQCKLIHKGRHYTATEFKDGIIIQSNKTGKGVYIQNAIGAIEAIKTAIDSDEAETLCRAWIN